MFSYQPWKLYWLESSILDNLTKSSSMLILHHFSRTWMPTTECKILWQLHNFITGSLYNTIIQMTTAFLLTKVLLGRASSRQYCPSQHCKACGFSVPPPSPNMRHSGPVLTIGLGQGRAHCVIIWNLEGCEYGFCPSFFMPPSYSCRLSLSWSSWLWLCFPGVSASSSVPGHVPRSSWPVSRTAVHWQWREVWAPVWQWWGNRRGPWQPTLPHTQPMPEHQSYCSAKMQLNKTWEEVYREKESI